MKHVRDHRQPLRPVRRPPRGGVVDALAVLQKAHVKAHTRKLKSGKVVQVRAYENKRTRKANSPAKETTAGHIPAPPPVGGVRGSGGHRASSIR